ncbi:MAG: GxxExxY protein [Chitinophagaceae bacterium]|nr:GxxExxY protein [Chitinophagaceae bacterium]
MAELLFKEESYKIVGICMEIHKTLGMGLKEINYKDAMEIDFIEQAIPYEREKRFMVKYKDRILRNPYAADFVIYDSVVVEIKSVPAIIKCHIAQTISYLSVSKMKLALIINFGETSLTWKRIVL